MLCLHSPPLFSICTPRLLFCRFWDPSFDDELLEDRVAMNLLHVQAVSDIDRGWVNADKDQHRRLTALQQKNSKKEVGLTPLPSPNQIVFSSVTMAFVVPEAGPHSQVLRVSTVQTGCVRLSRGQHQRTDTRRQQATHLQHHHRLCKPHPLFPSTNQLCVHSPHSLPHLEFWQGGHIPRHKDEVLADHLCGKWRQLCERRVFK